MSAALTHAAVGVLLGLAAGVRLRWLPLAAFLALLPDLDHAAQYLGLPLPVETRVTMHNLAFTLVLPLIVYAIVAWRVADPQWRRLAAAAPLLMTSHLFLDTLPLDISSPRVPLLWPFSRQAWTASARQANAVDPTAYSTITLLILILASLVVLTVLLLAWIERRPEQKPRVAAFAGAWVLVFPALIGGGFFVAGPRHVETNFTLDSATVRLPEDRFSAVVYHLGGNDVGRGAVRVLVADAERTLVNASNNATLTKGQKWIVDAPLPARPNGALTVRLVASADGHEYVRATPTLVRGHLEASLSVASYRADAQGQATLVLQNGGPFGLPAGAVRLVATSADGAPLANATNDKAFPPGSTWSLTFPLPPAGLAQPTTLRATATEDGFVYLQDARQPELALPGVPVPAQVPRTDP